MNQLSLFPDQKDRALENPPDVAKRSSLRERMAIPRIWIEQNPSVTGQVGLFPKDRACICGRTDRFDHLKDGWISYELRGLDRISVKGVACSIDCYDKVRMSMIRISLDRKSPSETISEHRDSVPDLLDIF